MPSESLADNMIADFYLGFGHVRLVDRFQYFIGIHGKIYTLNKIWI
jgi:hypothetical protein